MDTNGSGWDPHAPRGLTGDWLAVSQVAEMLDLDVERVRRYIRQGELRAYKWSPTPNGRFYIRPEDVAAFVEAARYRPTMSGRAA